MEGKKILVIDDCQLQLAITSDILTEAGYDVVTAESGIEANSHIYGTVPPNLILLDVVMPMLNGDQKVRLLKARETSRHIPVVLVSTKSETKLAALAEASGADGYIQKPLSSVFLLKQVRRFV